MLHSVCWWKHSSADRHRTKIFHTPCGCMAPRAAIFTPFLFLRGSKWFYQIKTQNTTHLKMNSFPQGLLTNLQLCCSPLTDFQLRPRLKLVGTIKAVFLDLINFVLTNYKLMLITVWTRIFKTPHRPLWLTLHCPFKSLLSAFLRSYIHLMSAPYKGLLIS